MHKFICKELFLHQGYIFVFVETVLDSCSLNFALILEVVISGAVELYCIIKRGVSNILYFHLYKLEGPVSVTQHNAAAP